MPPFSVMSLLEEFADETKKSGGNFFTPVEVVRLLFS
jgi:type I restriction-modification system DNA methylase subunit